MKRTIFLLILLIASASVHALPPFSTEFYGEALFFNDNISVGQVVNVYYNNNTLCGSFTVQNAGYYGSLSCLGDDTETASVDGALDSQNITFRIGAFETSTFGDDTFTSGEFKLVNITAPPISCGDDFCDNRYEGCGVCIADCGNCPDTNATGNATGNETGGGGSSSSSSSTSSGGGTGGGSGGTGATGTTGGIAVGGNVVVGEALEGCRELWECTEWGACQSDNTQERTCEDENDCGTRLSKPDELQDCDYLAHCYNGIQDKDETGIDCGGSCPICDQCKNGIKDYNEVGVDCGGPCTACPTCSDGKRNQGEEGIDCGGPCDNLCPVEIQRPGYACVKSLSPYNTWFLAIIVLVILSDVFTYLYYASKSDAYRRNKELDEFKRVNKIYKLKRKVFIYVITTLVLAAVLLLYYWFFGVCEELNIRYLWILIILLVMSGFLINYLVKLFEFNEKKKMAIMLLLENKHYKRLEEMIEFHKKQLSELINEINEMITLLMRNKEFLYVLETEPEFKIMYKDLVKIYLNRAKTDAFAQEEEKEDIEELKKITEQESFQKIIKDHPKFEALLKKIELVMQQYDDLSKVEEEKEQIEKKVEGEETERERQEKENKEFNDREEKKGEEVKEGKE